MITEASDFFTDGCGRCPRFATDACSARRWVPGLAALRRLALDAGLEESVRWGHPCYRHAGRNLALLGTFREDFRLTLPDAALLSDPEGLLHKNGPNSQTETTVFFTATDDVARHRDALATLLTQARNQAGAGERPRRETPEAELPEALVAAMDDDPMLAAAFCDLTPGRQRSYVIVLSQARTEATRVTRIARLRDKILAGKGANER